MTDAIFIIDEEFSTLQDAFSGLEKIFTKVEPNQAPIPQSFRFSVSPNSLSTSQIAGLQGRLLSRGWLFQGPTTEDYYEILSQEIAALEKMNHPFRMTVDQFAKHGLAEMLLDDHLVITIPLEDKVENTSRHMGRYIRAFSKALSLGESSVREPFEQLYAHAVGHLHEETPLTLSFRPLLGLFSKPKIFRFTPKKAMIGRHTILSHFRVEALACDRLDWMRLYAALVSLDRLTPPQLFLQYFIQADREHVPTIPDPYLKEVTFDLIPSSFEGMTRDIARLTHPTDAFLVLEHLGLYTPSGPSNVLYTLRKIPDRGYELRVNPFWEERSECDPDAWMSPIEDASGWSCKRIV